MGMKILLASLAAVTINGGPTIGADPAPPEAPEIRSPGLASFLSAAGTLTLVGAGAGQFYAGDPVRGSLVGLGGVVLPFGAAALVPRLNPALAADENPSGIYFYTLFAFVNVAFAYGCWAAWDAAESTRRFNRGAQNPK